MNSPTGFDSLTPQRNTAAVIELDKISVRYRAAQERIPSIKEYAIRWLKGQIRYQDFLALKEVSLKVMPGEVFGIVGPNGAGKSTLLKVVARVLKPTQGRVRVRGRISPLLELGAGFDHELTGRENIYLNGAILGFSKADLDARFDRIVDFAGLGRSIRLSCPIERSQPDQYEQYFRLCPLDRIRSCCDRLRGRSLLYRFSYLHHR